MRVSPSALDRFIGCELRWLLEAVGARGSEQAAQSVGTALHDVAAAAVTEKITDAGELGERLEEALERLDLGGAWTTRRERARARDMLGTFLRWERSSRSRYVLVDVEAPFSVAVPPETPDGHPAELTGRVDRLERDPDGRLVVVDLKTGRSKPAEQELARHPQLGAYQLAVASGAFGDGEPGGGVLVNLGTNAERARTQEQRPLGADDDPDWARDRVRAAATGMGGAVFRGAAGLGLPDLRHPLLLSRRRHRPPGHRVRARARSAAVTSRPGAHRCPGGAVSASARRDAGWPVGAGVRSGDGAARGGRRRSWPWRCGCRCRRPSRPR